MIVLDKVKEYYEANFKELEFFLEKTSFNNTNSKYPNSVVIKFGIDKIVGEISVWELETDIYMEFEFINLTKLENEPTSNIIRINADTIIENLEMEFNELKKIAKK